MPIYTERQRHCCDVALILLLRFLIKPSKLIQKCVATLIDQIPPDAPIQSLVLSINGPYLYLRTSYRPGRLGFMAVKERWLYNEVTVKERFYFLAAGRGGTQHAEGRGCLPWGGMSAKWGCLPQCMLGYASPCEQNDWQTGVKTLPFRNFVCGW